MQTRSGNPALQYGLLFGVILGIIEIAFSLTLGGLGFIIGFFVYLVLTGLAGYRASARTGKVSTGLVAGLLSGLFSSIIASLALFIFTLTNIDTLRQELQQQANTFNQGIAINYTNSVVIELVVLFLVIVIICSSLLALGIGAAGGAIGKSKAPLPPAPQYPPYQYPGQGQYPESRYMPPPSYPPQEFIPPQNYPPTPQDYQSPPQEKK